MMNTHTPLVSVLVPYYNDRKFIKESIDSILSQTFANFELILLNHASTDGSRDIARSYTDSRIVHIDFEKNYGAGGGLLLKAFLRTAQGKYIKFFCADDIMLPSCLQTLTTYFEENDDKDIIFSELSYINENGSDTGDKWSEARPSFSFDNSDFDIFKLLINGVNPLPYPTMMVKNSHLQNAYIDNIAVGMFDMFLWASICVNGGRFGFLREVLAKYRLHEDQICTTKKLSALLQASGFESYIYTRIFTRLKSEAYIQYVCTETGLHVDFDKNDTDALKFIIGMFYFKHKERLYRYCGFMIIHDLLQDDLKRKKIVDIFNFDIDNFREIYRTLYVGKKVKGSRLKLYFRDRILSKSALELNMVDVAVLFFRRIFTVLKRLLRGEREKPKYTV